LGFKEAINGCVETRRAYEIQAVVVGAAVGAL
jgi:hypothetical protein